MLFGGHVNPVRARAGRYWCNISEGATVKSDFNERGLMCDVMHSRS